MDILLKLNDLCNFVTVLLPDCVDFCVNLISWLHLDRTKEVVVTMASFLITVLSMLSVSRRDLELILMFSVKMTSLLCLLPTAEQLQKLPTPTYMI